MIVNLVATWIPALIIALLGVLKGRYPAGRHELKRLVWDGICVYWASWN